MQFFSFFFFFFRLHSSHCSAAFYDMRNDYAHVRFVICHYHYYIPALLLLLLFFFFSIFLLPLLLPPSRLAVHVTRQASLGPLFFIFSLSSLFYPPPTPPSCLRVHVLFLTRERSLLFFGVFFFLFSLETKRRRRELPRMKYMG